VNAKDNAGNGSSANVSYTVNYDFSRFQGPVSSAPAVNTGQAGRPFPLQWQLRDARGAFIGALPAIVSVTYKSTVCGSFTNDPAGAQAASTPGNSGLRYISTANQYNYNWASPDATGCYTLFLKLDSGQVFPAYFHLQ